MKQFTEREKRIINSILHGVAYDSYVLTNAFMDILDGKGIAFNAQNRCLLFDQQRKYTISDILQQERDFIETALLIQYLIDEQYIYIIKDNKEPALSLVGDKSDNPIGKEIPKDIADIFVNTQNRIVVTNKLYDLVNNHFLTYEGLQLDAASKQLESSVEQLKEAKIQSHAAKVATWISIATCGAAVLTLIIQVIQNIVCGC